MKSKLTGVIALLTIVATTSLAFGQATTYYTQGGNPNGSASAITSVQPSHIGTAPPAGFPPGSFHDGSLWDGGCDDGCDGSGSGGGGLLGKLKQKRCAGACDSGDCGGACGAWAHYSSVFGEFLYIRPRNAEIAYAVPIDGPIVQAPANNPIQVGRIAVVDPDYETGYSGGVNLALNPIASINARYTSTDFRTSNRIGTEPANVIRSIVAHPSTQSVQTDFLSASASLGIDYDTLDLTLRHLFVGGDVFAVNYFLGARYGQLDQNFDSIFLANETEFVNSQVDFEGVGLRLGFEAERHSCRTPLRYYARGAANFLAGRFRANYFQGTSFDPTIVDTSWEGGRIVPSLDLEIGLGWRSASDRFRVSVGYRVDAWYNMVVNEDFIYAVQQNNYLEMQDTITFDGLVGQAKFRF